MDTLFATILDDGHNVVGAAKCSLFFVDEEKGEVWTKVATDNDGEIKVRPVEVKLFSTFNHARSALYNTWGGIAFILAALRCYYFRWGWGWVGLGSSVEMDGTPVEIHTRLMSCAVLPAWLNHADGQADHDTHHDWHCGGGGSDQDPAQRRRYLQGHVSATEGPACVPPVCRRFSYPFYFNTKLQVSTKAP